MRIVMVAAAAMMATASVAAAQEVGDPEAGQKVFNKCRACHAVGEGATNKIGPELNGIIGEKPAAVEGYAFSAPFVEWAADKPVWDAELMSAWLADPRGVVPGTKMVFPGLKKPEELANVIAYLATFDESGASRDPAEALAAAAAQ
jgi:cytochrome c